MDTPNGTVLCTLSDEDQLLHITLNAPEGNIIDTGVLQGLNVVLGAHGQNPHLKAIILEGAGAHFSFGTSVAEHRSDKAEVLLARFQRVIMQLMRMSVPTIAVVRGHCLSGGLELATFCSWIFAAPDARFSQPEIKIGVFPLLGSILLDWRLGGGACVDLCVSGRSFDAEEARRMGLVHSIDADPRKAAQDFYEKYLKPRSASSLRFAERAARAGLQTRLQELRVELERLYIEELLETHDAREGVIASLAGRQPRYRDQ